MLQFLPRRLSSVQSPFRSSASSTLLYPGAGWNLGFVGQSGFPYREVLCYDALPANRFVGDLCPDLDTLRRRCEAKLIGDYTFVHDTERRTMTWQLHSTKVRVTYLYDRDFSEEKAVQPDEKVDVLLNGGYFPSENFLPRRVLGLLTGHYRDSVGFRRRGWQVNTFCIALECDEEKLQPRAPELWKLQMLTKLLASVGEIDGSASRPGVLPGPEIRGLLATWHGSEHERLVLRDRWMRHRGWFVRALWRFGRLGKPKLGGSTTDPG